MSQTGTVPTSEHPRAQWLCLPQFSQQTQYLGVAGPGVAEGRWCWEAQCWAALGPWLSPQVSAAVVASGQAGLCLKKGERKEGMSGLQAFCQGPQCQEIPLPEEPSGGEPMLIWIAPSGGPGTSRRRHP